jgi:hypothetical protein
VRTSVATGSGRAMVALTRDATWLDFQGNAGGCDEVSYVLLALTGLSRYFLKFYFILFIRLGELREA